MSQTFVHLRLHSEYSLSDGMVRIKPLATAVAEMQMPAVAVSDDNNLFALIKFYKAASEAGVKPLIAADVWVSADDESEEATPLVLIARNEKGYRNLSELLSRAYLEGQALGSLQTHKATLQRQWIAEQAQGLIALSAGRQGDVGKALLSGRHELASQLARQWLGIFPDAYYLELQRTGRPNEEEYIQRVVDLALQIDCPVVATNDVRFSSREEYEAHEARICIHDGRTLDDPRRERRYTEQQYLKSPEEMCELFADIPEAIENTVEIAKRCNVKVNLGDIHLPEYQIPDGYSTESFFYEVSERGLEQRLEKILYTQKEDHSGKRRVYEDRLAFELDVINNMGFAGYFLIVMEFVEWARDNDIPVGPGRGSGAGSLVAYALRITDVDPLEYDLLFERFLNPERVSLPDFDIDFCMDGRDRVIQHVTERYGRNAVSQIITFGTMAAKAVVRDVARVQGKSYGLADKLSKLIPFKPGMTLDKALDEEPLLGEFISQNEDADEIMEMAFKLEGLARNVGKHAGGVVIAPTRITDYSPIYCDESGANFMTQFDMNDVEQAGLVKFDFLGLRTLTIIDNAVKSINQRKLDAGDELIEIGDIFLEDPAVFEDLRAAKTTAVFQLESRGMKDLIKQVKPNRFGDIVALVALFRPGPLELKDDFVRRKIGIDEVDYLHPSLQPVLEGTYGVMLYQEQVMQIAQVLAGYTLADADLLRRAMGKKKPEEMAKQRDSFLRGAQENGVDGEQADHIFNLMEKFAGYGFNKPHSVAYALIAYQTAWLKHYYPVDFMAAVLSADMQNTDKVVINIEECREMDIAISPPNVNKGGFRFVADSDKSIIYGLGAIKGVGEGPVEAIVNSRCEDGQFDDLYDLCERVDGRKVNKRAIEALIGCGALDELACFDSQNEQLKSIDYRRALLFANQEDAARAAEQKTHNKDGGLMDLFGEDTFCGREHNSRYNYLEGLRSLTFKDRLNLEKETLGLYLTGHPFDLYETEMKHLAKTRIIDLRVSKDEQIVAGLIVGLRTMKSKKGGTGVFVTLDDKSARLEVSVFEEMYEAHYGKLQKDTVIFCKGVTSVDDFTGGMRMRATDVYDLIQAREKSVKRLRLSFLDANLDPDFTSELACVLEPFKAPAGAGCPVSIAYIRPDAQAEVTLGDAWRVSPDDDLIQNLRDRYGFDKVALDY